MTTDAACLGRCSFGVLGALQSYTVADLVSCRARSCMPACALTPSGTFSQGNCDECIDQTCPDAFTAARADRDATRLGFCRRNCGTFPNENNAPSCACESGLSAESIQKRNAAVDCATACCTDADWGCVGSVKDPGPKLPLGTIHLHFWLQDFLDTKLIPGVTASSCAAGDLFCAKSVRETGPSEDGTLDIPIEQSSAGIPTFFEMSGEGIITTQINGVVSPPLIGDTWRTALLFRPADASSLGQTYGDAGASTADLGVLLLSCGGRPAPDMQLEVVDQPGAKIYYLANKNPNPDRTVGGFAGNLVFVRNVAPGGARVRVFHADHPEQIVAQTTVPTKANVGTFFVLGPTQL